MVGVRHALADVLTSVELQERVCKKMEDAKGNFNFAAFEVLPPAKAESPTGKRALSVSKGAGEWAKQSLLRLATWLRQAMDGFMSCTLSDGEIARSLTPPASITASVKRARIRDPEHMSGFLQTLVMNAFPSDCKTDAYVENLVNAATQTRCGTDLSYSVMPSGAAYEVGRLSVKWLHSAQTWDVIFLSLDNQGCVNLSSSVVSAHFEAKIASLRRETTSSRPAALLDF